MGTARGSSGAGVAAPSQQSAPSAVVPQLLVAVVGDNHGMVSGHIVQSVGADVDRTSRTATQATATIQTRIESVTSLLCLPPRDSDADGVEGLVMKSSAATVVAAGLGGPITILSVALGFERKNLMGSNSVATREGGGLHLSILRVLNSMGAQSHPLGVSCMTYCASERCLVTTGVDRRILLWNVTDAARAGSHIGQLGTVGTSSCDRDAIVSLACNDMHNQIVSITKSGRIEVFDPRTLACTQRLGDDAVSVFTRGVLVDPLHLSVLSYGSHLRAWPIREAFLNATTAAVAAATFVASERATAFTTWDAGGVAAGAKGDATGRGGGGIMSPIGTSGSSSAAAAALSAAGTSDRAIRTAAAMLADEAQAAMAATPWKSLLNGYILEAPAKPRLPSQAASGPAAPNSL
ncbi:hypothetical protein EON62_04640, partial [archaeon]